jgi:hypothetical protein
MMHVRTGVEKLVLMNANSRREMTRRYVRVARPSLNSGVGSALRQAYDLNGAARDLSAFEDLLARLD